MKPILMLLLATILAGCLTNQPLPKGYNGPTAWIEDTHTNEESTRAHIFQVLKVDDRSLLTSTAVTRQNSQQLVGVHKFRASSIGRYVPAGTLHLEVEGTIQHSAPIFELTGETLYISGHLEVTLEENTHYQVAGILTKDYRAIWVESRKGKIISNIIEEGVKP